MAITTSLSAQAEAAFTYTCSTGSHDPSSDVAVACCNARTGASETQAVTGNSLTWVEVAQIDYDQDGNNHTGSVHRADAGSASSGATTFDAGSTTGYHVEMSVHKVDGCQTGASFIVQSKAEDDGVASQVSITMTSSVDSSNALFLLAVMGLNNTWSSDTGFTDDSGSYGSYGPELMLTYDLTPGSDTITCSHGGAFTTVAGVAFEVAVAAGGGGPEIVKPLPFIAYRKKFRPAA